MVLGDWNDRIVHGATPELEKAMKKRLSHSKETLYENTPAKQQPDVSSGEPAQPGVGSPRLEDRQVQYPFPFDRLHELVAAVPKLDRLNGFLPAAVAEYFPAQLEQLHSFLDRPSMQPLSRVLFADKRRRRPNYAVPVLVMLLVVACARVWSLQAQLAAVQTQECPEVQGLESLVEGLQARVAVLKTDRAPPQPQPPQPWGMPPAMNFSVQSVIVRELQEEVAAKTWMHNECMHEFETHLTTMLAQYRLDLHSSVSAPVNLLSYAGAVETRLKDMGVN